MQYKVVCFACKPVSSAPGFQALKVFDVRQNFVKYSCTCFAEAWRRRGVGPSDAAPLIVRWPSWDNRRKEKSRPPSSNGCWQKVTVFQPTPPAALAQCHDVWRLATKVLLCHSSLPSPAWPRGLVPPPIASDIFSCEPTAWRWTPRKKVGRRRDSQHPEEGPCW